MSITKIKNSVSSRYAAGAVGIAMALTLVGIAGPAQATALTAAQISSIVSLLQSFGADPGTVANVQATLSGQSMSSSMMMSSGASVCPYTWARSLRQGSRGADVMALQQFLNAKGYMVAASGPGSKGMETMNFGPGTKAAVKAFQMANNISPTSGYFGVLTRKAANAMCVSAMSMGTGTTTTTTGTTTTTTGTTTATTGSLVVAAGTQPANAVVPVSAARVPFTTFTLTNPTSAPVTVSNVTVTRTGVAADADFSSVVLLDPNGLQIGYTHTFNSNHQTQIGDTFTVPANSTVTYTVAGNIAASGTANAGDAASLQVSAVNTSAAVSGSLPISGATDTINTALSIGSVSTSTSSYDPGAALTKNIGNTSVRFSGIRFTAGANEDLKLASIRWRQVGTSGAADFSNVVTGIVSTTATSTTYPTTVDSTGKYYTTVFPSGGLLIPKGQSVDVYVQGDLTGSNLANRTIQMNVDKVSDVYFVGQTYGYGIAPSGTYTPWYTGYATTVNGGTATSIQNAVSVPSANVPLNVSNTVLGGIQTNFIGEPVTVTQMVFRISYGTATASSNLLTNVSLVGSNGTTVAGPVNAVNVGSSQMKVTFTNSVTFPVGVQTYTLVGQIPTGPSNGDTIAASTTPSGDWSSPTGQTTSNSVTLPSSTVTLNTQTIQSGQLKITSGVNPVAQNIVAGVNNWPLGTIQLDASQSGENIRLASLPVSLIVSATANATNLNTCQLNAPAGSTVNGVTVTSVTPLNTGGNVVNPTSSNTETSNGTTAATFTFDAPLVVPKGTVVTLTLNCNLQSGAALTSVAVGVNSSDTFSSTGVSSGASITPTATTGASGTQTITTSGTLTSTAASTIGQSPSVTQLVAAGTTGVQQGLVKFHASNEPISLTKVGLTLANGTYGSKSTGAGGSSNSGVNDVTTAYIYNGSTLIGTATFTGTAQTATSTLSTPILIQKDADLYLTIKTDIAQVGFSAAGGIGDTVKVDPLNAQAIGQSAGDTINISATAGVNGVQMFRSVPVIALASGACSGTSCNGSNQPLKVFTVTANASNPVSIEQLEFTIATSSANVTSLVVSVYDNNGGLATSTFGAKQCASGCTSGQSAGTSNIVFTGGPLTIPAGLTYTFKLLATVAPGASATQWSVAPLLQGTSTAIVMGSSPGFIGTTTTVANADDVFVWSDNATTTAGPGDVDWFGGLNVTGLQAIGI